MQYLDAVSKTTEWSLFISKANHSVSQQSKSVPWQVTLKSWSWMVLWRSTRPSRTNTLKRCPFHYRGLECKSRKSEDTCSNRQIWPWNTEWSRAKENRVMPRECAGYGKHALPTREDSTHGHHQMANTKIRLIMFFASKHGEALYSHQKQDLELTEAQIMNFLLPNSDLNWRK